MAQNNMSPIYTKVNKKSEKIICNTFPQIGYRVYANNVSNVGGDPVTQLIVNVYQMIKL